MPGHSIQELLSQLGEEIKVQRRLEAIKGLRGYIGNEQVADALTVVALTDHNGVVLFVAGSIVNDLPPEQFIGALERIASGTDQPWGARTSAIRALGELGDPRCFITLTNLVESPEKLIAKLAQAALDKLLVSCRYGNMTISASLASMGKGVVL